MTTMEKAKAETERIAREMRSGAEKLKGSYEESTSGKAYSYTKLVQRLRLAQLITLPLQALTLYGESDRVGLLGFLVPLSFICANIYLTLTRWQQSADGRANVSALLSSKNNQTRAHHGIQVLGSFILILLVHALSPLLPTSISSLIFRLSDYLLLASSVVILFLDGFEGVKNKLQ